MAGRLPTWPTKERQLNDFATLGLSAPLLEALTEAGYTTPTPIQSQAVPPLLAGRDLVGIAQTGTGKTAAFALPILHRLTAAPKRRSGNRCRCLVLSPTRELTTQIGDNFRIYGAKLDLSIATIFGGVAHRPQIQALSRGVDVLVATPGRLLDHMATGHVDLADTEILVLDEADQMLDLGFLKPIRQIVGQLPKKRQTLLFSATMPGQIARLAQDFLRNPERISVAPVSSTAERVSQRVVHIAAAKKRHLLVKLLAEQNMFRTLVFTRTKHGADRLAKHLTAGGITVAAIHGNKSQPQRERALEAFRQAKIQVLVATDIAARGIDIDDVSHVINFELPEVPEAYVHRIGRTARAGAAGSAISFCDDSELKYLRGIERLTRQRIPSETYRDGGTVPDRDNSGYDPVATADAERESRIKRNRKPSSRNRPPKRAKRQANQNSHSDRTQIKAETGNKAKPHRGKAQGGKKSRNPNAGRDRPNNGNAPRRRNHRNHRGNGPRQAAAV